MQHLWDSCQQHFTLIKFEIPLPQFIGSAIFEPQLVYVLRVAEPLSGVVSDCLQFYSQGIWTKEGRRKFNEKMWAKYVAEYEHMRIWMVEFLSKFHGHGIKIARMNSILVAKPLIFFNIISEVAPWVT